MMHTFVYQRKFPLVETISLSMKLWLLLALRIICWCTAVTNQGASKAHGTCTHRLLYDFQAIILLAYIMYVTLAIDITHGLIRMWS